MLELMPTHTQAHPSVPDHTLIPWYPDTLPPEGPAGEGWRVKGNRGGRVVSGIAGTRDSGTTSARGRYRVAVTPYISKVILHI